MSSTNPQPPEPVDSVADARPESGGVPSPIGRAVSRGATITMILSSVAKMLGLVAQLILARILGPDDFGVYFAALAFANLMLIFRDGGVRDLLVQRGVEQYPALVGPIFWMAFTINLGTAALLAAAAPFAANYSGMPEVRNLLLVTAIALPLATPAAINYCKLRLDLRFAQASRILTTSAIIRYATMVGMALMGMGPMSFVIPLVVIALYENVATYAATREKPWTKPASPGRWLGFLGQAKWLYAGTLAGMMVDQGDYFVATRFVTPEVLGYYGFANQMLLQSAYAILVVTTSQVLFPSLVRLVDDPRRHAEATAKFLRALMLIASPACIGLAVVFEPFEKWLYGAKWDASVLPLWILAAMYPLRCTFGLTTAMLMSQGRFKRWALLTAVEGALVMLSMLIAASRYGTPVAMAIATASTLALTRTAMMIVVLRRGGTPASVTLASIFQPWSIAVVAAMVAVALDHAMGDSVPNWLKLPILGGCFGAVFAFGARLLLVRSLHEAIAVAPARLVPLAHRLLLLKPRS